MKYQKHKISAPVKIATLLSCALLFVASSVWAAEPTANAAKTQAKPDIKIRRIAQDPYSASINATTHLLNLGVAAAQRADSLNLQQISQRVCEKVKGSLNNSVCSEMFTSFGGELIGKLNIPSTSNVVLNFSTADQQNFRNACKAYLDMAQKQEKDAQAAFTNNFINLLKVEPDAATADKQIIKLAQISGCGMSKAQGVDFSLPAAAGGYDGIASGAPAKAQVKTPAAQPAQLPTAAGGSTGIQVSTGNEAATGTAGAGSGGVAPAASARGGSQGICATLGELSPGVAELFTECAPPPKKPDCATLLQDAERGDSGAQAQYLIQDCCATDDSLAACSKGLTPPDSKGKDDAPKIIVPKDNPGLTTCTAQDEAAQKCVRPSTCASLKKLGPQMSNRFLTAQCAKQGPSSNPTPVSAPVSGTFYGIASPSQASQDTPCPGSDKKACKEMAEKWYDAQQEMLKERSQDPSDAAGQVWGGYAATVNVPVSVDKDLTAANSTHLCPIACGSFTGGDVNKVGGGAGNSRSATPVGRTSDLSKYFPDSKYKSFLVSWHPNDYANITLNDAKSSNYCTCSIAASTNPVK